MKTGIDVSLKPAKSGQKRTTRMLEGEGWRVEGAEIFLGAANSGLRQAKPGEGGVMV